MKSKRVNLLRECSALEEFERSFVTPRAGRTLIVGSRIYRDKEDRRKRYPGAVGVDMLPGDGVDVVLDLEGDVPATLGQFDHVECMSVLEHSMRPWLLAANLERLMRPGATIFVSVPLAWALHGYPSDFWRMTPEALPVLFPRVTWAHRMIASNELGGKLQRLKVDEFPYFPRAETCGFGALA